MRRLLCFLPLLVSGSAHALDACPLYKSIHEKEIVPKIKSGIPFKLMSIATNDDELHKNIVHLKFDLWSEKITIETIGGARETSPLKDAESAICRALSLPRARQADGYHYRLLLNPVLGESFKKTKGISTGFLKVDWNRLARDLETEKVLIDEDGQ
jgi:hypothetical protein